MYLIRIGSRVLNLDNVTRFTDRQVGSSTHNSITIVFIASGGEGSDCIDFDNADADILRAWLTENALDISAQLSNTRALVAAMHTALLAIRSNPAGAEAVLINALADAAGQID